MESVIPNQAGPYVSKGHDSGRRKKLVAVVTPVYRLPLTAHEELSLKHLRHYLGEFDRYIIAPEGLTVTWPDFRVKYFDETFFVDVSGYSKLLLAKRFYRAFADYEYILIYQLDCLVFSSDLAHWCAKGWDYAGAPWFRDHKNDPSDGFWAVGNGGLSLRNVSSALSVLESKSLYDDPVERGRTTHRFPTSPRLRALACKAKTFLHRLGYRNTIHWYLKELTKRPDVREDRFWALDAKRFLPQFRIPSPEEAVAFSFECAPRYCFKANAERLPFGCHAWERWDRTFWEPHLLR
jgi:hypothetical protein